MNKRKKRFDIFWIALTILSSLIYLVWRVLKTTPYHKGMISNVFWVILFLTELAGIFEMIVHFYNMYGNQETHARKQRLTVKNCPDVDVLIPTLNEPASLLRDTVRACLNMDYPKPSAVHIYLCDDGEREEVRALAQELGIFYLARPSHEDAKAGNLNYALQHSSSACVAVFDADMQPRKAFLMETACFFAGGSRTGFVQTPQNFYEPDLFQRNLFLEERIPNEQDYFYRAVQPAKNKSNSVIFGGSNALLSRKALEEIGGFVTGTLTEDFATGIELEKKGWRGIAIDQVLADGRCPDTFTDLVKQRSRWAAGCIQSGRRTHVLLNRELTFSQKMNYLVAIGYWYSPIKRLIYYLAPVLFAVFGIVVLECTLAQVLMFWLPMYLCTMIATRRFSHRIRTTRWSGIYENVLFPFLLGRVLAETLGFHAGTFRVTRKDGKARKSSSFGYMIPFLLLGGIDLYAIVRLIGRSAEEQTPTYLVILFWLILNFYYMLTGILITWGRTMKKPLLYQRTDDTMSARTDAALSTADSGTRSKTQSSSEACTDMISSGTLHKSYILPTLWHSPILFHSLVSHLMDYGE